MKYVSLPFLCILVLSCQDHSVNAFDIQGHRGCRGHMPENSIEGMLYAIELGATTLEMDVVITKDHKVILSHEPYLSTQICLDSTGKVLPDKPEQYNIYAMTFEEVAAYDCGSKTPIAFPMQKPISLHKPLLSDLLKALQLEASQRKQSPYPINVEIKREAGLDHIFHPPADRYASLVLKVLADHSYSSYSTIQSFDIESLQAVRSLDETMKTALLVAKDEDYKKKLEKLGFLPDILSPAWTLVDEQMVEHVHNFGGQVIPWTVNQKENIIRLYQKEIDGIISDYPDRVKDVVP